MRRPEAEIVTRYRDLVGDGTDPDLVHLVRDLDTGLTSVELPPALWEAPPALPAGYGGPSRDWKSLTARTRQSLWVRLLPVPGLAAVLILLAVHGTLAISNFTNLGKPTDALPQYHVLGSFHRAGPFLRQRGKPELLFLGTMVDSNSAAERWPIVKALDQFGTLSNVGTAISHPCVYQANQRLDCTFPAPPPGTHYQLGYATFDWDHARYTSRYLTFVHINLIDVRLRVQRPGPLVRSLFNRYVSLSGYPRWKDAVWRTAASQFTNPTDPTRQFPLISVGGYLDTGANVAIPGDLQGPRLLLPFSTIQDSLRHGRAVRGAPPSLITDYNAEANIITALICHADRMQPKHVCGRAVIRKIVRHVR